MKAYKLLFISFLFLSFSAFAQPKKEYYDSEQLKLKSESNIVKGMPHGRHVEYYKNGKMKWKGSYRNGDQEFGLLEHFDSTGVLVKTMMCDSLRICRTTWLKEGYEDKE